MAQTYFFWISGRNLSRFEIRRDAGAENRGEPTTNEACISFWLISVIGDPVYLSALACVSPTTAINPSVKRS